MPDENTIRHYRNRLTESGTLEALMQAFEQQLREAGYLAMGGQIVDASLVPAPKQRNTQEETAAIKAGKSAKQIWRGKPDKAHQKDVDARWTVKIWGQDPLSSRWDPAAADRHPGVWLQVPYQHRPALRPGLSMFLRTRKTATGSSSVPSAWPARRQNSRWPTWSTTATA